MLSLAVEQQLVGKLSNQLREGEYEGANECE
jgi:hypothetical protein